MAELWKDGPDHYGVGNEDSEAIARMIQGPWAELDAGLANLILENPVWEDDPEKIWLFMDSNFGFPFVRRLLGGTFDTVIVSFRMRLSNIPSNSMDIFRLRDATNSTIMLLRINPDASVEIFNIDDMSLLVTAGPVVASGTNHHFEIKITKSTGSIELRIDEVTVLNGDGLAFTNGDPSMVLWTNFSQGGSKESNSNIWFRDFIVRDDSGAVNNDFMGDLGVTTIFPVADTAVNGWTARFRRKLGTGILDLTPRNDAAVAAADATEFDMADGDFTIETFVRFSSLPAGTDFVVLAQQWDEAGNERSWQLLKAGPDFLSGHLVFRISTDGQAGTVTNIHSQPFNFALGVWYHVAVSRAAGVNRLFVDGVQLGTDKTDTASYHNATSALGIGAEARNTSASGVVDGTSIDGFTDEYRWTVGVGRYTANFAPPTEPFPRDSADPDFASVVVLAGWDNGVEDESSFGRTLTALNSATNLTPNDGDAAFQVIDDPTPLDDTFVEAALIPADAIFTLSGQPADSETVTIDARTYTYVTTLANPDEVLIGADADESLTNLKAAINKEAGEGTLYGTGTDIHPTVFAEKLPDPQVRVIAKTAGAGGNSIGVSDTVVNGSWDDTTLTGGQDIPGPSEFVIGNLPPFVTGVRSVSLINRAAKSDAGPATMRTSFVGSGGASTAGAETALPTAPAYHEDIFETDPDTGGALTPATLTNARFRIDRLT